MLKKLKERLAISPDQKLKIFKAVNKFLFCQVLKFHLPTLNEQGVVCIICENKLS